MNLFNKIFKRNLKEKINKNQICGTINSDKKILSNGKEYQLSMMDKWENREKIKKIGKNLEREKGQEVIYEKVILSDLKSFGYIMWTRPKNYKNKFLPKKVTRKK